MATSICSREVRNCSRPVLQLKPEEEQWLPQHRQSLCTLPLILQPQQGNIALKTLKLALLLPLFLCEWYSNGLWIFHSHGFPDLPWFSHRWTWNKLLAWKLMSESSKGSNYLLTPKCYWFLLIWFGGQRKNPFWDLCLKPMINEKNIVNSNCCGLNWALLIVLPPWWVQEMFTESTELALIHHMAPSGCQRSVIWAVRGQWFGLAGKFLPSTL